MNITEKKKAHSARSCGKCKSSVEAIQYQESQNLRVWAIRCPNCGKGSPGYLREEYAQISWNNRYYKNKNVVESCSLTPLDYVRIKESMKLGK